MSRDCEILGTARSKYRAPRAHPREGFRRCRTPPNSPRPLPRPPWRRQHDGVTQLDELAHIVGADDFERDDPFWAILDRDRARFGDQMIQSFERHPTRSSWGS